MDFLGKLKETMISVLPIMGVVIILNFTIAPLGSSFLPFIIGGVLLIAGLTLFLAGTDIGMVPVGEKLGSVLAHKGSLPFMLILGFLVGFGVTYAEPDVNVLASQVNNLNPSINEKTLILFIAIGLGVFVDVGLFRVLKGISLRRVLIFFYLIVFVLLGISDQSIASISFDASGSTTGPLAVPFILALGLGVSSASKNSEENSFGLTGIASIGPVLSVALMAVLAKGNGSSSSVAAETESAVGLGRVFVEMTLKTIRGFGPLAAIILILQFVLLKFPRVKFRKICLGIIYSFIGIVIFLTGVEYGFSGVGKKLGTVLSTSYAPWVSVVVALLFGAIVVFAEPAVWVLTQQIEDVTAGRIRKRAVMIFLCVGVAVAVSLAILRSFLGINYLYFVYGGVGLSLVLSFFCPQLFTGIAFDSGGVASGPMSTSFILSYALGVSGSAEMGFGVVGLIAISPLISLQILGIIFRIKEAKQKEV